MGEISAQKHLDESGAPSIPVIDFSAWTSSPEASSPQRRAVARELVAACHHTGFVYIKNHGISDQLLEEAFDWAHKFFDLPTEQKMQARHAEGSASFRGFSWPGLEKTSALSEDPTFTNQEAIDYTVRNTIASINFSSIAKAIKESYDIGSDDNEADPNIWLPESTLPGFRKFLTEFYWECWKTSQEVLRALALGLGLDNEEYFLPFHNGHADEMNVRYYPPVHESALANQKIKRLSAHTDFDTLTLLFQDDCGGLQLEKPGHLGEFIDATPIPKTLVMNIGDALMRWSNGNKFHSHASSFPKEA